MQQLWRRVHSQKHKALHTLENLNSPFFSCNVFSVRVVKLEEEEELEDLEDDDWIDEPD